MIPIRWSSPAPIPNLDKLLQQVAEQGGSIIQYKSIFSLLIFSQTSSEHVWVAPGKSRRLEGLSRSIPSLLLGWWSLPGLVFMPGVLLFNVLLGGADLTALLRYTYGSLPRAPKASPPPLPGGATMPPPLPSGPPPLPSGPPPLPGSRPEELDEEQAKVVLASLREAGKFEKCRLLGGGCVLLLIFFGGLFLSFLGEKERAAAVAKVVRGKDLKLSLMKRQSDGSLTQVRGPLMPSMPCPVIKVEKFSLTGLRPLDAKKNEVFVVDVTVSGTVASRLCDLMPGNDGVISQISLMAHRNGRPVVSVPITVQKRAQEDALRPFPFDGKFELVAKAVPVSEGNNIFELAARQPAFHTEGRATWVAIVAFPDPDDDPKDPSAVKAPTIAEQPHPMESAPASEGEAELYCVVTKAPASALSSLVVSGGKDGSFAFEPLAGAADTRVVAWPHSKSPAFFALRPSQRVRNYAGSDEFMVSRMSKQMNASAKTPRDQFLWGLATGLAAEGYDLVFSDHFTLMNAVHPDEDGKGFDIDVKVATTAGQVEDMTLRLEPSAQMDDPSPLSLGDLSWRCADLFRRSDPKASKMALAMLTEDFSELGIEGHLDSWRSAYYMHLAEALKSLHREIVRKPDVERGYRLGTLLADGLRVGMNPTETTMLNEMNKATFLTKLLQMPSFGSSRYRR